MTEIRDEQIYFFIHLHKTAGTSFGKMLRKHFAPDRIYPNPEDLLSNQRRYPDLTPELYDLVNVNRERLNSISLLCGHYPFIAGNLFSKPLRRMVFFRHPLARTISHLKHAKRFVPELHHKSLADIFKIKRLRRLFLSNSQTKAFSYHTIEEALRVDNPIKVDRSRLELAKENISKCDFVGLTEDFAGSIKLCERVFGWEFDAVLRENVSIESTPKDDKLERRILSEIELDLELYEFVCGMHKELRDRYLPPRAVE